MRDPPSESAFSLLLLLTGRLQLNSGPASTFLTKLSETGAVFDPTMLIRLSIARPLKINLRSSAISAATVCGRRLTGLQ
jgi:hypothetical protein